MKMKKMLGIVLESHINDDNNMYRLVVNDEIFKFNGLKLSNKLKEKLRYPNCYDSRSLSDNLLLNLMESCKPRLLKDLYILLSKNEIKQTIEGSVEITIAGSNGEYYRKIIFLPIKTKILKHGISGVPIAPVNYILNADDLPIIELIELITMIKEHIVKKDDKK